MLEQLVTLAFWRPKQRQGYKFKDSLGKTERTLCQTRKFKKKDNKNDEKVKTKQTSKQNNHPPTQTNKQNTRTDRARVAV